MNPLQALSFLGGGAAAAMGNRISTGVGIIRERTIDVGDTTIIVDNIGSVVFFEIKRNFALLLIGAVIAIGGLVMMEQDGVLGVIGLCVGVGLAIFNLMQKSRKGLSIGTCDNRITYIISQDEAFLSEVLTFLRRKIDTGNVSLTGKFDITNNHFESGGGGIAVGAGGVATGKDSVQMGAG
jgi:hypothetical protein